MKKLMVVAIAALAFADAQAETYQTVTSSMGNTSSAETMFTSGWSADGKKQYWSDELPPHPDADYTANNLMGPAYSGSSSNHVFNGHSCTIGHFSLYSYAPDQITFANEGLILKADCDMRDRHQSKNSYIINGKVCVSGTNKNPSRIRKTSANAGDERRVTYFFTGAFSSQDSTSRLVLPEYGGKAGLLDLQLAGDVSGYAGMIDVNPTAGTNYLSFVGANQTFPGTVKLTSASELHISGSATSLGKLETVVAGSVLDLARTNDLTVTTGTLTGGLTVNTRYSSDLYRCGSLTFTNLEMGESASLTVNVTPDIRSFYGMTNANAGTTFTFLTVPAAVDTAKLSVNLGAFAFAGDHSTLPWLELVEAVENGVRTYSVRQRKVAMLTKANGRSSSVSVLDDDSCWSDGLAPHDDSVYFTRDFSFGIIPENKALLMPTFDFHFCYTVNMYTTNFTAKTITFCPVGHELCGYGSGQTMEVAPGVTFKMVQRVTADAFYAPYASGKAFVIRAYEDRFLQFVGELSGGGNFVVKTRGYASTYDKNTHGGYVFFDGPNTNFTGTIETDKYQSFHTDRPLASPEGTKLVISRKENLGGPRSSFTYDAMRLQEYCSLYPIADVTLDDTTRGIALGNQSYFIVPKNVTLTIREAVTINGRTQKEGEGTLVLAAAEGQKLAFGSTREEMPTADKNVFNVTNGFLKVTSKFAADGFALTFMGTGKLLVGPGQTADTAYCNVKGTTASDASDGKIPVSFESPAGDEQGYETVVATSKDRLTFNVVQKPQLYAVKIGESQDTNGNYVYTATVAKTGTLIFFR